MDSDEFAKTRRVVVPGGLGIAIRLQDGICCHNLFKIIKKEDLYTFPPDLPKKLFSVLSSLMWQPSQDRRSPEEIQHLSKNTCYTLENYLFGIFCFARPTLTSDQHRLVLTVKRRRKDYDLGKEWKR